MPKATRSVEMKRTLDVVREVSKATGIPTKKVYAVIKAYTDTIARTVLDEGKAVSLGMYGTFTPHDKTYKGNAVTKRDTSWRIIKFRHSRKYGRKRI